MTDHSPAHVLLVEDNPGDADLVRLRLAEGRFPVTVHCVNRLSAALESITNEKPTLVLLDLTLPDSNGAETFRKVLKHSPDVPIVILSGTDDEALAISALQQGAQDYLVKGGLSGKQLEHSLRYAMERQALIRAMESTQNEKLEFKSRLLSHVSHELRTPLTCIHQYVSLIADGLAGPTTRDQEEYLEIALQVVNQLQAMIRDLLEASRAENGKLHVEPQYISIGNLVEQAVAMLHPVAQKKGLELRAEIESSLPPVYADPDRVLEVLINLIENAIKFTPAEGSVVARSNMNKADRGIVSVSVSDTGRGISPQMQPLIFERLNQEPGTMDSETRMGLGLGLFISRELIRLQNGKIWVTSEPGKGSVFTFTLPIYSLAELLSPVVSHEGGLRPAFVLTQVHLASQAFRAPAKGKELERQCLETIRRSVYLDKDLVLPTVVKTGAAESFFIVASTDLEHSKIMTTRIRGQLERIPGLNVNGGLIITTSNINLQPDEIRGDLGKQIEAIAAHVSEMIMRSMTNARTHLTGAENRNAN